MVLSRTEVGRTVQYIHFMTDTQPIGAGREDRILCQAI